MQTRVGREHAGPEQIALLVANYVALSKILNLTVCLSFLISHVRITVATS